MKYIVNLTTRSPISLRNGREQINYATLDYFPGAVVLGTLASAHALLRDNSTEFNQFFFDEQVRLSNLYPASFKHKDLNYGESDPVYPLPTTALSCKRFSGFKADFDEANDKEENRPHGVWDGLITWTLFALSGRQNIEVFSALQNCPACQEALDHFEGFYRRDKVIGRAKTEKELRTRTGINRKTGATEQGILYNREIISTDSHFWGTLTIADEHGEAFDTFVQNAQASGLLRLGNNRTRGLGNVILNLNEVDEDNDTIKTLQQRVESFNAALQQQAKEYNIELSDNIYIPITLTSEVILVDSLLQYSRAITPQHLAEVDITGAELIYQNSDTRRVVGWHHLWGLPKADELAITMGSVFLFGFKNTFADWQALLKLQTQGLGSRRRDGFGQVMIANPFHWEVKGL